MPRLFRLTTGAAGSILVLLAVSACAGYGGETETTASTPSSTVVAPANTQDGGLVAGSGPNEIDVWLDFQCGHCLDFEKTNGSFLQSLVETNTATVRLHPLYFLDRGQSQASLSAANALVCVADHQPDAMLEFNQAVFALDPGSWDIAKLQQEAQSLDIHGVDSCIQDGTFTGWLTEQQEKALSGPLAATTEINAVRGTPTIIVNGSVYSGPPSDNSAFVAFFESVKRA
ncbi:thioredoxin domain-containing protein [Lysinibacter sp. HNR]|uniref:DsbA family protein n=1 Tax=Lysinibacter sp. HNR TaxID=3031408 RepID=UPI002435236F|nr:thioredoxin domain-containing protein [Lysinibacter sp. HNR]WGD36731.1 thioredoxin domain-containing protein [Lysinibacter sp. HNR]